MTLFSERYGHKKVEMLKKDEMPNRLRTRIWNVFYSSIFVEIGNPEVQFFNKRYNPLPYEYLKLLWHKFFGQNLQVVSEYEYVEQVQMIYKSFEALYWYMVYDFVEFGIHYYDDAGIVRKIVLETDNVLREEHAQYCVLNNRVVPLMSEEEIAEIEKALDLPDKFESVHQHLEKALLFWADRNKPDFANSIKESISAVESLVQIQLGKSGTLGKLIDELDVHPALKKGFSNLYGWTSNEQTGIRHAGYEEELKPDEPEARYILITCSAFVNYVIAKLSGGVR